jgi:hypothetical protein
MGVLRRLSTLPQFNFAKGLLDFLLMILPFFEVSDAMILSNYHL